MFNLTSSTSRSWFAEIRRGISSQSQILEHTDWCSSREERSRAAKVAGEAKLDRRRVWSFRDLGKDLRALGLVLATKAWRSRGRLCGRMDLKMSAMRMSNPPLLTAFTLVSLTPGRLH